VCIRRGQRVRERGTARGRREPPCPLYALVFLRPEDFLTVGEAICTTLRICVMVSARERENIGQVTNGFAEFKDALAQGPRCLCWWKHVHRG
jgi:hypothetical protein